jgi:hypothetical protein
VSRKHRRGLTYLCLRLTVRLKVRILREQHSAGLIGIAMLAGEVHRSRDAHFFPAAWSSHCRVQTLSGSPAVRVAYKSGRPGRLLDGFVAAMRDNILWALRSGRRRRSPSKESLQCVCRDESDCGSLAKLGLE